MHWLTNTGLQVTVRESTAAQWFTHLHWKIQQQRKDKWAKEVLVLHDSARPHTSVKQQTLAFSVYCPTTSAIFIEFGPIRLCPVWQDERCISGHAMEDVSHCTATNSLTMMTSRVVSASQSVLSQKTGLLDPSGSYQKDGTVHWPQWGECGVCWSVIVQLS
jgi:hypothetical protein